MLRCAQHDAIEAFANSPRILDAPSRAQRLTFTRFHVILIMPEAENPAIRAPMSTTRDEGKARSLQARPFGRFLFGHDVFLPRLTRLCNWQHSGQASAWPSSQRSPCPVRMGRDDLRPRGPFRPPVAQPGLGPHLLAHPPGKARWSRRVWAPPKGPSLMGQRTDTAGPDNRSAQLFL